MKRLMMIAAVIFAIGVTGLMGFHDELAEERTYCDMVAEGTWPAYRREIECEL